MANEKTNIEHLKDIMGEISKKTDEAEEFYDAAERELTHKQDRIKELEEENSAMEKQLRGRPDFESTFLGLDTLRWELKSGNLIIQQRMENFISSLQKEFCVSETSF